MKKVTIILAVCSAILLLVQAASAVSLYPGPYYGKYTNYESFVNADGVPVQDVQVGDFNVGVFIMSTINAADLFGNKINPTWFTGTNESITGYFRDIEVADIQTINNVTHLLSTGGTMDIYYFPTLDGAYGDLLSNPTIENITSGTLMVSFDFTVGVNGIYTVDGTATSTSWPFSGSASSYLKVIPNSGPWAKYFDGNATPGFPDLLDPEADAYVQSDYRANANPKLYMNEVPAGANGVAWQLASDDPIRGTIVPEPGSMILLGSGLIGLGLLGRRKFFN